MGHVDVNVWAWEVVRYKYKFYKAGEHEVSNVNVDTPMIRLRYYEFGEILFTN